MIVAEDALLWIMELVVFPVGVALWWQITKLRDHMDEQFEKNHQEHREAFERISKIEGKLDD